MAQATKFVTLFTGVYVQANPGTGGYGVVLVYKEQQRTLAQGYGQTTINRLEALAAIHGLSALKGQCRVEIVSCSTYLVRIIQRIAADTTSLGGANVDLWQQLKVLCQHHQVSARHVKGEARFPENWQCVGLAAVAMGYGAKLLTDEGYIQPGSQ